MPIRPQTYRPDVDGLRAIAVLSVVMFHFAMGPLRGGFAGVDIFFVISGYLITGIIQREVAAGEFTFGGFYERRVRRIFPALFAMLLTVMLLAPLILLPSDLSRLSGAMVATLLFTSNILFWRQSGYFDPSSQINPLLHTWSLAVEEQFYIGFPILMLLIGRFANRQVVPILVLVGAASFALDVYFQPLRPTATFYLSPFRAWELILGALLAVGAIPPLKNRLAREAVAGGALLVLIVSLWWLEEGPAFPGWIAGFPVVATAALLQTGASGDNLVRRMLSLKPLVGVGLISYSLYLWHWPLLAYANYVNGMQPLPKGATFLLLGMVFLLAFLTYRWVEVPFRHRRSGIILQSRKEVFSAAAVGMTTLGLLAASGWIDDGWKSRFPPTVAELDRQRYPDIPYDQCDAKDPGLRMASCIGGKIDGNGTILLWGDSHALAWAPALDIIGKRAGMKVIMAPNSACPPLLDVENPVDPSCDEENDKIRSFISTTMPDIVVMVGSWNFYSIPGGFYTLEDRWGHKGNDEVFRPALQRTYMALRPYASSIILAGPTPGAPGDAPFRTALSTWKGGSRPPEISLAKARERDRWFWEAARGLDGSGQLHLVDPVLWFCGVAQCRYINSKGQNLYRDASHLSVEGAFFVANQFPINIISAKPQEK